MMWPVVEPMHPCGLQGSPSPLGYRVLDDVEFAIDITEVEGEKERPYK